MRRIKGYRHLPLLRAACRLRSGGRRGQRELPWHEYGIEAASEFQLKLGLTAMSLRPAGSPLEASTYYTSTPQVFRASRAVLAARLSDFATNCRE